MALPECRGALERNAAEHTAGEVFLTIARPGSEGARVEAETDTLTQISFETGADGERELRKARRIGSVWTEAGGAGPERYIGLPSLIAASQEDTSMEIVDARVEEIGFLRIGWVL